MARYTGPRQRIARRYREPIFGHHPVLQRKNYPPGQHGRTFRRRKSDYGIRLEAKQKAKFIYGLLERQFRRFFEMAQRMPGNTGENLLQLLESRLDNVVYRMGFAKTRAQARQLVNHKHFRVNGKVVNIPSYLVKPGDVIEVREKSKDLEVIQEALNSSRPGQYHWLEVDRKNLKGRFIEYPQRNEIPEKIEERLIIEFYSR
jgi:small subunit ribosomal protein S4